MNLQECHTLKRADAIGIGQTVIIETVSLGDVAITRTDAGIVTASANGITVEAPFTLNAIIALKERTEAINAATNDFVGECGFPEMRTFTIDANLQTAFSQVLAQKVMLCRETDAARIWNAIHKAMDEIEQNPTVVFKNGILSFVSRQSNEQRCVTKNGCVKKYCPCENLISYHSMMFAILERRAKIIAETKKQRDVITRFCGCRYNDSFEILSCCAEHRSELDCVIERAPYLPDYAMAA